MKRLLLLFLLAAAAAASPLSETETEFSLPAAGISLYGTNSTYSVSDIESSVKKFQAQKVEPADYAFQAALFAAEAATFTALEVKFSKALRFSDEAYKKAGLTTRGKTASKDVLKAAGKKVKEESAGTFSALQLTADAVRALAISGPTPGGLRKAAKHAVYCAAENYAYALSKGVSPGDPKMNEAADYLRLAVLHYRSFSPAIDAASLTYTKYTPTGFNKVVENSILSVQASKLALKNKPAKKSAQLSIR
ncbi:MAG: hypothetical protein ABH829_04080 [archaeon]